MPVLTWMGRTDGMGGEEHLEESVGTTTGYNPVPGEFM